jgi:Holliday junction resolvase RusA-like endonuclease
MTEPIRFSVVGVPAPQGSKTRFGKVMVDGTSKTGRAALSAWRGAVATAAREYVRDHPMSPLTGPVRMRVEFRFAPVASSPHRFHHATTPDSDKLLRSTGDALVAGGLLVDDRYLCHVEMLKRYAAQGEAVGCNLVIESLMEEEAAIQTERKLTAKAARKKAG